MPDVSPVEILRQVSQEIPRECHGNLIVVGSLAAAYQLLAPDAPITVRTKDLDCILSPRIEAVKAAKRIAEVLIAHGWQQDKTVFTGRPGNLLTPVNELPIVRLHPPGNLEWFIELLTVPGSEDQLGKNLERIEISEGPDPGYYGLPSFRFLSLAAYLPVTTPFGIQCARPEMMALSNILEHPRIRPERMTGLIEGRSIKRSNKDLGRVLAIARLCPDEEVQTWAVGWLDGLRRCFPTDWENLASSVGSGLEELLESPDDLEEAHHSCVYGLLSSLPPTLEQLRFAGVRLVKDALVPLRKCVRGESP